MMMMMMIIIIIIINTGANCDALQLEGSPTSRQSLWAFSGQICTMRMPRNYCFRTQNYDIATVPSD